MLRKVFAALCVMGNGLLMLSAAAQGNPEPVTITLWHHWGGSREPLMVEQLAAFEEAYPWITVENSLRPQEGRLEALTAAIAANEPPDVVMFQRQEIPSFVLQNALTPLDPYLEASGVSTDIFYPSELASVQFDGNIWGLPQPTGGGQQLLWYNVDLFESAGLDPDQPPQTWDELRAAAEALTVIQDGFLEQLGVDVLTPGGNLPNFFIWLYANGGSWISDDLRTVQFDSPEGLETLQFMLEMVELSGGVEELTAFTAAHTEAANAPWYQGRAAMEADGVFQYAITREYAPEMNFRVAPLPYGPSGSPDARGAASGGWSYVIPANSDAKDAAWLLVEWLTTEMDGQGACWFLEQQDRPSPMIDCTERIASVTSNTLFQDITAAASLDQSVLATPIQPQINDAVLRMVESVLYGSATPEEALATAAGEAQTLLDEFWAAQS
jgi:ABC-type glycerol-3-phosphate transport system substrate-binding protein